MMYSKNFDYVYSILDDIVTIKPKGKISKIVGLTIESEGPPAEMGEICIVKSPNNPKTILTEVVGFRDETVILMPLGDMEDL